MSTKVYFDERTGKVVVRGITVAPGSMDLKYKHFAGDPTDTNEAGKQNFCVKISEEDAEKLQKDLEAHNLFLNIKKDKYEDTYFKIVISDSATITRMKPGRTAPFAIDPKDTDMMRSIDKALIADGAISCSPCYLKKYSRWTCYLSSMWFIPCVDPVQEEIDAAEFEHPSEEDVYPTNEVPFE